MVAKLLTRPGELVAEVQIPVFNPPPDVIHWGSRVFISPVVTHQEKKSPDSITIELEHQVSYIEGFAWVVGE